MSGKVIFAAITCLILLTKCGEKARIEPKVLETQEETFIYQNEKL